MKICSIVVSVIALFLSGCLSAEDRHSVQSDFVPALVDKKFYSPTPILDEQAWNEFAAVAKDRGKTDEEIQEMRTSLLETVREEIYQQAIGVGVWAPEDQDEFAESPEVVVTSTILGISIAGSLTNETADANWIDRITGEGDVRTKSNEISLTLKLSLSEGGRRAAGSDAEGVGEIVLSREESSKATADISDLVDQGSDSDDAVPSVLEAASESVYETDLIITNGLLNAGDDAVRKAAFELWASYRETVAEREKAKQP